MGANTPCDTSGGRYAVLTYEHKEGSLVQPDDVRPRAANSWLTCAWYRPQRTLGTLEVKRNLNMINNQL
ncbi:unnamed protein product [Cyprideis torosa]|uniref:Uncharacterized protein n=1 Tax=Cyprideis torosa TaxID=163714 RepID=A0A7R8ZLI9_9CRUS|nr:unnamed protein product [Cyprideis torosa]CAG0883820.1 unnamed protein product [Cyprideis torosa]